MKRFIIYFLILGLFYFKAKAQVTNNPTVGSTNCPNCTISKIEITPEQTIVSILYQKTKSNLYQSWISISSLMFIIDKSTNTKYQIIKLNDGLLLDNQYATTGKIGTIYNLNMVFPHLPSGLENFDIIEITDHGTGFIWNNVKINNPDTSPKSNWTEPALKNYWSTNKMDINEGIYELTASSNLIKYRLAVKKSESGYDIIYIDGATGESGSRWKEGDIKATLTPTAKENFYKVKWYMLNKEIEEDLYVTFENALMNVIWTNGNGTNLFLKLYPLNQGSANTVAGSGSGFALSTSGLIVTNYHVVNGADHITVRGINGDFSKKLNAKVVLVDKNNDLAIIKIDDNSFHAIKSIPYNINNQNSDVGENVFALGYPLRATMGDEIKLTNGIISSKSGYQGDITSYQISVPIQPGNSGGPLLNKQGDVIGIVNAKLTNAEDVSYAVKVNYLMNLVELLSEPVVKKHVNPLSQLPLSEQVKSIKNFIYIIEVN
jgi:S1-C subfamily serine protease